MPKKRMLSTFTFMGQFEYRVYQRENGFWYAHWKEEGQRQRQALGVKTKREAMEVIKEFDRPLPLVESKQSADRLTIQEAYEKFIYHREVHKKRKPKTIAKYRAGLDSFTRYCKGKNLVYMDELTLDHFEGFQIFREEKEKCGSKCVHHDYVLIKMLYKFAAHPARKLITENPALAWEMEKPRDEKRRDCFSQKEVDLLTEGVRDWLKPLVTTLAYTGMRIGELTFLRWQDVDLEQNQINITARSDWTPKSGRSRMLPIHPNVRKAILTQKPGRFVFTGFRGGQYNTNHLREAFEIDRNRLGVTEGTPHSFRHFFISLCANVGIPELICMQWVGHTESAMVRHYYHPKDSVSQEAMNKVAYSYSNENDGKLLTVKWPSTKADCHSIASISEPKEEVENEETA